MLSNASIRLRLAAGLACSRLTEPTHPERFCSARSCSDTKLSPFRSAAALHGGDGGLRQRARLSPSPRSTAVLSDMAESAVIQDYLDSAHPYP
jgi:hypothetical protein